MLVWSPCHPRFCESKNETRNLQILLLLQQNFIQTWLKKIRGMIVLVKAANVFSNVLVTLIKISSSLLTFFFLFLMKARRTFTFYGENCEFMKFELDAIAKVPKHSPKFFAIKPTNTFIEALVTVLSDENESLFFVSKVYFLKITWGLKVVNVFSCIFTL